MMKELSRRSRAITIPLEYGGRSNILIEDELFPALDYLRGRKSRVEFASEALAWGHERGIANRASALRCFIVDRLMKQIGKS